MQTNGNSVYNRELILTLRKHLMQYRNGMPYSWENFKYGFLNLLAYYIFISVTFCGQRWPKYMKGILLSNKLDIL